MSTTVRAIVAAVLLAGVATPSAAEEPAAAPAAQPSAKPPTADADKLICEKQTIVGSRLATKRVCKTRAQWAEQRLQDRQEVERVQTLRGINGPDD